jgi:hypothetical protein
VGLAAITISVVAMVRAGLAGGIAAAVHRVIRN